MYVFSKTPEQPKNPICPANVGGVVGTHEPLELVGSDLESYQRKISCHDGGTMLISLCRLCGLMYYRTMDMEESIIQELKGERRGLSERYLRARVSSSRELSEKFNRIVTKLVEAGTIQRTEQDDGTVVFAWKGDD